MGGWISIHRQLKRNWLWDDKPFSKGQAWIDILLRVNHKAKRVPIGNVIVDLEPGQTIWSIKDMAESWGWSRKKVDNFLKMLQNDEMLHNKRTSKYTLLTVANWALYQDGEHQKEHQKNIIGTSKEHQKNTNNNDNNDNNEEYTIMFTLESEPRRLTDLLISKIIDNNEFAKVPTSDKKIDDWCLSIDRLIRLDKAEPQVIANVINWCQNDNFWKNNILSTGKLRKKFPELYGKYKTEKSSNNQPATQKPKNQFHNFDQRDTSGMDLNAKFGVNGVGVKK